MTLKYPRQVILTIASVLLTACSGGGGGASEPLPDQSTALSGTISIAAGTRVDTDNGDALQAISPLIEPQLLPREFTLAGYVSGSAGDYPPLAGQVFSFFADPDDQFLFQSVAGFEITLQAFQTREGGGTGIELKVSDASGNGWTGQDTAVAGGSMARVVIPSGTPVGEFQIDVSPLNDSPMLYVLSAQSTGSAISSKSLQWPDYDFAQDEALVRVAPNSGLHGLSVAGISATKVKALSQNVWKVRRSDSAVTASGTTSVKKQTLEWIEQLRNQPSVEWASPNYIVRSMNSTLDEPLYTASVLGQGWHYDLIKGPLTWQLAPNGAAGVSVAILDTGLFRDPQTGDWHEDLAAHVAAGYDAIDGDLLPADPGNAVGESVYHGTHVAGTVGAVVNNRGGGGVAFGSTIVPVRVLGEGGTGTLSDLIEAVKWVSQQNIAVVNMSLGGLPCGDAMVSGDDPASLQSVIRDAASGGNHTLFVAAGGNNSSSIPTCPADLENVLSVGAVDAGGSLSSYSNYGNAIDLVAPGGDAGRDANADGQPDLVSSTSAAVIDGTLEPIYRGLQGTSMAAPHVSGILALMKAELPQLNADDVASLLQSGRLTDCPQPCDGTSDSGYGLIDGAASMQAALDGNIPEVLNVSPSVLDLTSEAGSVISDTVEVSPLGDYSVTLSQVVASDSWFTVSGAPSLPHTLGPASPLVLTVELHPEQLEPGVASRGKLSLTYSSGTESNATVSIPVVGQIVTDEQAKDAGRHFVLLVNPKPVGDSYETVAQTAVMAVDGEYSFSFQWDDGESPQLLNEVPPGDYFLVAGSDLDNDGYICQTGEACAEYPVSGLREVLTLNPGEPVEGIRMTTSYFRPSLSSANRKLMPRPGFSGYKLLSRGVSRQPAKRLSRE